MFTVVALLASFATAGGFSLSSSRAARSTSLQMGFEDAIGAQPPLGKIFLVLTFRIQYSYYFPVQASGIL